MLFVLVKEGKEMGKESKGADGFVLTARRRDLLARKRDFWGWEVRLGEQVLGLGVHAFFGIGLEGVMVVLGGGLDNWVTAERLGW
jgi:hypothetical protein